MNREAVKTEIARIIEEKQSQIRWARQYKPAKHQIATLNELGILDLMPDGFGYTDAATVIDAARNAAGTDGAMNANGEGETWTNEASTLYVLLNAPKEQRCIIKTNGYYWIESDPVYNRLRIETPTLMIESVSADDESAVRELYELYEQLVTKDEHQYIEQLADDIWRLENMTPSFEGIEELELLERQQMAHKRAWLQSRVDAAPAARLAAARELLAKRDESE